MTVIIECISWLIKVTDIYRYTMAEIRDWFEKQLDISFPFFAVNYSPFPERRFF